MKQDRDLTPFSEKATALNASKKKDLDAIADEGLTDLPEGEACRSADGGLSADAQRREAPGVNSSNTPPQSSKNNIIDEYQWIAAEDWFEWALYVDWGTSWPKLSQQLSEAKEMAAIENCPREKRTILFWGGCAEVDRIGDRLGNKKSGLYYAYKLHTEYLTILIADQAEPHKTKPSVVMRADGTSCLLNGAYDCYQEGMNIIREFGGRVVRNKLSRVDICLDMPGKTMEPFDRAYLEERYICRARSHGRYSSGGITVQLGKYPLMLRIYDKLAEVEKKKNPTQTLGMLCNRWGGKMPESAIRVEFELGRDFLKKKGVDSVEDYYTKRAALLNYVTHDWMRFTQNQVDRENKNQSKAMTLPIWQQVRDYFLQWAGSNWDAEL
ncbi:MAG TPA: hypothetical protein VLM37_11535, partial [Fibrobacteraceae bacterium]|nr:hypothetical protein [Fibrobacteraceae bacterium]